MKTHATTSPAHYVGTYAKYNAGSLKGAWLKLEDYADRSDFLEACAKLHDDESDPELMFQDREGLPHCWYCESSAPDDIVWEWMQLGDSEREAFGLYAAHLGGDVTVDQFRDAYAGVHASEADFCEEQAEGCSVIPKDFPNWIAIDWRATWDRSLQYDYFCESGESGDLHFFNRNS